MVRTKTRTISTEGSRPRRFQFDVHMLPYAIVALALILVGVKVMVAKNIFDDTLPKDVYQAVFLNNGQVYFGHLTPMGDYFRLEDVYYIRQDVQDTSGTNTNDTNTSEEQSQFSVIRLGEEIHQPENLMIINEDDIMFWENLQSDSRVVAAIAEEKSSRE